MQQSAKKTALGYLVFSGAATLLAFFLPAYVWAVINQFDFSPQLPFFAQLSVFDLFLFAALFQGQYRLKTTVTDLGLKNTALWKKLIAAGFYVSMAGLLILDLIICNIL